MFKKNTKSKKFNLKHLNDVFYVFKKISNKEKISEDNEQQYIELLLKQYLEDKDKLIEAEIIERCKKEFNEIHWNETKRH